MFKRTIKHEELKGGVSVVEKWEYNNVVNKYMRNGGNKK